MLPWSVWDGEWRIKPCRLLSAFIYLANSTPINHSMDVPPYSRTIEAVSDSIKSFIMTEVASEAPAMELYNKKFPK
jgi:hypothetical protein